MNLLPLETEENKIKDMFTTVVLLFSFEKTTAQVYGKFLALTYKNSPIYTLW